MTRLGERHGGQPAKGFAAPLARPRPRRTDVYLVVCALLVGFGVTFGTIRALGGHHAAARGNGTPAGSALPQAPPPPLPSSAAPAPQSPAALDAQWLDYSNSSTCADWAGGDGVTAIRLSSTQVAWFFADTFLGPAGPSIGLSQTSGVVHNSVVVQTTSGDSSRLVTATGGGACATPAAPGDPVSVVRPPGGDAAGKLRYWDADGMTVGGTVVKFYSAYQPGPIPYIPAGTTIASYPVSQLSAAGNGPAYGEVLQPGLTPLPAYTPRGDGTPIVWGSALLAAGRTVYVYGWQSPSDSARDLYLAKVPAASVTDFAAWQFFSGGRWASSQSLATPIETAGQGISPAAGFSVVPIAGRYWLIQSAGLGDPDIDAYPAAAPWGPFSTSGAILLYQAPGIGLNAANDYRALYEARAEPALSAGGSLVISYNVSSEAVTTGCVPMFHYTNTMSQPRFISVPTAAFRPGASPVATGVLAAEPDYPQITQQNPQQWSSSMSDPGGCPPVPAVSYVSAQTTAGTARLTWPDAGLGLMYRVSADAGPGSSAVTETVLSPGVTLTGLSHGMMYQFRVAAINLGQAAGPPAVISAWIP